MYLIDVGVNLMDASFDHDREEVIKRAKQAGVSKLILSPTGLDDSLASVKYALAYNENSPGTLYSKIGIHPHNAKNWQNGSIKQLRYLAQDKVYIDGIVALGECGLDYNRDFSPRDMQRLSFTKQAELAAELSLPLFLHVRDAFDDFAAILNEHIKNIKAAVIHCFTGTGSELDHYLSLGCYIGITGWICDEKRGKGLRELIKNIPPNRLLLETDAPFLYPKDLPGNKRNEPCNLVHIANKVSEILGKDPLILAEETYRNSLSFFAIVE